MGAFQHFCVVSSRLIILTPISENVTVRNLFPGIGKEVVVVLFAVTPLGIPKVSIKMLGCSRSKLATE